MQRIHHGMVRRRVLLVDSDRKWLDAVRERWSYLAQIDVCTDFAEARTRLFEAPVPELLVTNLRLGPFNGLHLVFLAQSANLPTRCLTYGAHNNITNMALAREAQSAGAFYEASYKLPHALSSYLQSELPDRDRRDPTRDDRRGTFRGGRRATDLTEIREIARITGDALGV
jgi:DNA-binding NtrC family response regulator